MTTSRDFCFWLRGYIAATGIILNKADVEKIQQKLGEVVVNEYQPSFYPWYCATNTTAPVLPPAGVTIT